MSNSPPSGPPQGWGPPNQPNQPGQPGPYAGQPGQPGQPWGGPAGPPPGGPGKRNLLPFIIAGVVVVVVAVVLAVLLMGNSGGSSPKDTAEEFIAAAKAHDCEKALTLITDDLKRAENANCSDNADTFVPPDGTTIEFGDVTISGETDTTATAKVDVTTSGQTIPITLELVKQDGEWMVNKFGG